MNQGLARLVDRGSGLRITHIWQSLRFGLNGRRSNGADPCSAFAVVPRETNDDDQHSAAVLPTFELVPVSMTNLPREIDAPVVPRNGVFSASFGKSRGSGGTC